MAALQRELAAAQAQLSELQSKTHHTDDAQRQFQKTVEYLQNDVCK